MNARTPPSLGRDYIALPWSPKIVEHCIVDLSMLELSGFADGHVKSVAYSPDGKQIASGSDDFTVRVWEVSTGLRRMFRAHSNEIGCLAFSPDGTLIVSVTTLIILSTGRCFLNALGKANFPGRAVDPFAFSADGRYLAWGGLNWCCKIYDASTHQTIVQLVGHTGDLLSVAFFPDDKQIMSA